MDTKPSAVAPPAPPATSGQTSKKGAGPVSSRKKIALDVRLTTTKKAGAKRWFPVVEGTSFRATPSDSVEEALRHIEQGLSQDNDSTYELPRSGSRHESLTAALEELRSLNIEE